MFLNIFKHLTLLKYECLDNKIIYSRSNIPTTITNKTKWNTLKKTSTFTHNFTFPILINTSFDNRVWNLKFPRMHCTLWYMKDNDSRIKYE